MENFHENPNKQADEKNRTEILKRALAEQGQGLEKIENLDEETLVKLLGLWQKAFPAEMIADPETLKKRFQKISEGVLTVLKNDKENNEIVGAIIAEPNDYVLDEMVSIDPAFQADPEALYADTMAIAPGQRSLVGFLSLEQALVDGAKDKGFKRITTYARVANKLSDILQRRLGYKFVRRVNNWANTGEDFDFLVKDLEIKEKD